MGQNKWNIFLDFYGTCTKRRGEDPMDAANKAAFRNNVKKWLASGHNVAIITRETDDIIASYFTGVLGIHPATNEYSPGRISILAPTRDMVDERKEFWAKQKTIFVSKFLDLSASWERKSIFMDDTILNVRKMREIFPDMVCEHVKRVGDYRFVFDKVNIFTFDKKTIKRTKRRSKTRKNKRII